MPNDWAILPSCLGDKGLVGGAYRLDSLPASDGSDWMLTVGVLCFGE